ncbi:MAG: glycerate kinase [bacterium]
MKILICPDSFKESLSAIEVCDCIERGLKKANSKFRIEKIPLADGGEGTVKALVLATHGRSLKCKVRDPLGKRIWARYGILGDGRTAIIEMAAASGLALVPMEKRNPLLTTTYGTGEIIVNALNHGCRKIIIGIGGSATVDGGAGMAQSLGARLLDGTGKEIGFGGGEIEKVEKIDLKFMDRRIAKTEFIIASDVKNPLLGSRGAARVYGPQKGATPEMVERLERGLSNLARVIRKGLSISVRNLPGSGAAGGLGAGLYAFLGAEMENGVELVMRIARLEYRIKKADLVITGEGQLDRQTLYGKAVMGVINTARKYGVPVICVAGSIMPEAKDLYRLGVKGLFSITTMPMSLQQAMEKSRSLLINASENLGHLLNLAMVKRK